MKTGQSFFPFSPFLPPLLSPFPLPKAKAARLDSTEAIGPSAEFVCLGEEGRKEFWVKEGDKGGEGVNGEKGGNGILSPISAGKTHLHSPGTKRDSGQWDHEGAPREEDEPIPPSQKRKNKGQGSLHSTASSSKASDLTYKTFTFKTPTAGAQQ